MIVINVVIGGISGEELRLLAHVTVQLQVSNYSQLSDYTVGLQINLSKLQQFMHRSHLREL